MEKQTGIYRCIEAKKKRCAHIGICHLAIPHPCAGISVSCLRRNIKIHCAEMSQPEVDTDRIEREKAKQESRQVTTKTSP
jgi:hypothetical protein